MLLHNMLEPRSDYHSDDTSNPDFLRLMYHALMTLYALTLILLMLKHTMTAYLVMVDLLWYKSMLVAILKSPLLFL